MQGKTQNAGISWPSSPEDSAVVASVSITIARHLSRRSLLTTEAQSTLSYLPPRCVAGRPPGRYLRPDAFFNCFATRWMLAL
jgi:hypothetical protein